MAGCRITVGSPTCATNTFKGSGKTTGKPYQLVIVKNGKNEVHIWANKIVEDLAPGNTFIIDKVTELSARWKKEEIPGRGETWVQEFNVNADIHKVQSELEGINIDGVDIDGLDMNFDDEDELPWK